MKPFHAVSSSLRCGCPAIQDVVEARFPPRPRVRRWSFVLGIAALLCSGLPALASGQAEAVRSSEGKPPVTEAAPITLSLPTLDHGQFELDQHRGRWVVANYWATWCAPCRKEMPELDALHREREDVNVLGLAFEEISADDMRAFLAERPVSYPIAIVDVYAPPEAFEIPRGMPMTYLLDPQGRIAHRWLGPVTKIEIETRIAGSGE